VCTRISFAHDQCQRRDIVGKLERKTTGMAPRQGLWGASEPGETAESSASAKCSSSAQPAGSCEAGSNHFNSTTGPIKNELDAP
jgi:hypothetical protein